MRKEEWIKVEEMLDALLEVERAQRPKLLGEICASAPELRREVESLLACDDEAAGFLSASALAFSTDFFDEDGLEDRAGQLIGHYRIIREIGRGGMGAVYLAERSDGEFQQQVALKVVGRSFADTSLRRRFRRERQILASLNHPNIARLLDGGVSSDGEPYLVMEYVEGARIDDYCVTKNLLAPGRLQLFLKVCHGVSYAHRHLVVHRDIKPSNILITDDGVPKLLDFGIAKLLDPEQAGDENTRTEMRAFTPEYASPEQKSGGQITTASDVYSLGILLRDLLSGARLSTNERKAPGGWRSETPGRKTVVANLQTNQEGEEKKAQARPQRIAADLEKIVAMACHEDPARRYASAAQVAEDVQRYLSGLPVLAQKDSFTYRASKFVGRNKVAVGAAAVVLLSLVVGLVVVLWQAGVARRERDRAERRFNEVRQLANALLTEIAPKVERLPGAVEARQALVNQSLKYLDSLVTESADDPSLQSELASAYEKVGQLQGNPTNPNMLALSEALVSYEKAAAMRRGLLEKNPGDAEQLRLLADNYRAQGDIRWQTKEAAESLKNSEEALAIYTRLLTTDPGSIELRLSLARANHDIGKNFSTNEKYAESIAYFQKCIGATEELRRQLANRVDVLSLLGNCYKQLGNSLSWDGRQKEAEAAMPKAVAIFEELVAANPDDVILRDGLYHTYRMTASVYEEQNDTLSNEYAFKALKIMEKVVESDPTNLYARLELARTYSHFGVTLDNVGKGAESLIYHEKAVVNLREVAQKETKNRRLKHELASAFIRLGDSRYKQRDFQGSIRDLEQAALILTEIVNTNAEDNSSLRNLANTYDSLAKSHEGLAARQGGAAAQGHHQAAFENYQRALDLLRRLEARGALSNYDRKSLEEMQAAVRKYEQGK